MRGVEKIKLMKTGTEASKLNKRFEKDAIKINKMGKTCLSKKYRFLNSNFVCLCNYVCFFRRYILIILIVLHIVQSISVTMISCNSL